MTFFLSAHKKVVKQQEVAENRDGEVRRQFHFKLVNKMQITIGRIKNNFRSTP